MGQEIAKVLKVTRGRVVKELLFKSKSEAVAFMNDNNGYVRPAGTKYMHEHDFLMKKGLLK